MVMYNISSKYYMYRCILIYTNMLIDCINKDITKDHLFKNAIEQLFKK